MITLGLSPTWCKVPRPTETILPGVLAQDEGGGHQHQHEQHGGHLTTENYPTCLTLASVLLVLLATTGGVSWHSYPTNQTGSGSVSSYIWGQQVLLITMSC